MSEPQGSGPVTYGVVIPASGAWGDPGMIMAAIEAAEDLGFDTAWFGDHIVIPDYASHLSAPRWFDALSCMLVGAGATTTLRFGSDVLVLPYRDPVGLSQLLASADQLSGGRLTLGAGVGYISGEFAALRTPPYEERGAVTDEYLRALRVLWESDGAVRFEGRWVSFENVHAAPEPLQDPFPVWVGGNGKRARRRAATLGNGWHPLFPTPEQYAEGRADIESIRAVQGLTGEFTFAISCPYTQVLLDPAERKPAMGYTDLADVPEEYHYAPSFPSAPDGRPRFHGTADEVAADIRSYIDAGVEHFALRFWIGDPDFGVDEYVAQLERFNSLVLSQGGVA